MIQLVLCLFLQVPAPDFCPRPAFVPRPIFTDCGTPAAPLPPGVLAAALALPLPPPPPALQLWATANGWCAACVPAHKLLDEIYGEGVPCSWVEFDEWRDEAQRRGVYAIPTWVISQGDREVARLNGVPQKAALIEWLKRNGVPNTASDPPLAVLPANAGLLPNTSPVQGRAGGACSGGQCTTWRRGK